MAQTIVVQEQALNAAQARLAELEQELASRPAGGGFLSGLFGGGQAQPAPRQQPTPPMMPGMGQAAPARGGGFLAGAAQTAMGVAGGMLVGNMLADAFGGDDKAGEANNAEPQQAAAEDTGSDEDFSFDEA